MGSNLSPLVTVIAESGLVPLLAPFYFPGKKENAFKMLKCMKFAPLSSLGAVISNKPFGFFFWSIFNCLVGKAKLLLKSLIFLTSAVTWISPFSSPPLPLPTDPPLLRAFHPCPWCHMNDYQLLLLSAPSCSSLRFLNTKHVPGVFHTSQGLRLPWWQRCWRRQAPKQLAAASAHALANELALAGDHFCSHPALYS